jgi:hypothetical protein
MIRAQALSTAHRVAPHDTDSTGSTEMTLVPGEWEIRATLAGVLP